MLVGLLCDSVFVIIANSDLPSTSAGLEGWGRPWWAQRSRTTTAIKGGTEPGSAGWAVATRRHFLWENLWVPIWELSSTRTC